MDPNDLEGGERPEDFPTGRSDSVTILINDGEGGPNGDGGDIESGEGGGGVFLSEDDRKKIEQLPTRIQGRARSRTAFGRVGAPPPSRMIRDTENLDEEHHSFAEVRYHQHQREMAHDVLEMDRRIFYKSFASELDLVGLESGGESASELPRTDTAISEEEFEEGMKNVVAAGGSEIDLVFMEERDPKVLLPSFKLAEASRSIIREAFEKGSVILNLQKHTLRGITHAMLEDLENRNLLSKKEVNEATKSVEDQESEFREAFAHSYNVVFGTVESLDQPVVSFAKLHTGVNFDAPDGTYTIFFFMILTSSNQISDYRFSLGHTLSNLMSDDDFHTGAWVAHDRKGLLTAYDKYLNALDEPEESIEKEDKFTEDSKKYLGLTWTRKFAGGLMEDFRRKLPWYVSDWKDGFTTKALSAVLVLFLACFTPAVAFGGLMDKVTHGNIGVAEMVLATSICGIVFAVFSGQPLVVLGGTGPMLIFTGVLYDWSERLSMDFLAFYGWVGIWIAVILIICALADAAALNRFCTRFTDEIFAALISLLFIYEALKDLVLIYGEGDEAVSFYCTIIMFGTHYLASTFKNMPQSPLLRHWAREFLADFGTILCVALMTGFSYLFPDVHIARLDVPDEFGTTNGRGWLVNLGNIDIGGALIALFPAVFASVLLFLDQNITARIVNRTDHKLKKGPGYHLDMLVLGILVFVCSLFGLPWLVAATVNSLVQVTSLATVEEIQDGQHVKKTFLQLQENRLSATGAHLLIACMLPILFIVRVIPMSVLFGLFLFMGVTSLQGNQFFERMKLWFFDPAHYPQNHIVRNVPLKTIHKFTALQLLCLAVLWAVKMTILAILFPLFILLLIPLRALIVKFISPEFLEILDWEEEGPPPSIQ
eukprot:TRINITY_DN2769_c3_g1_i1.p1 TRINITY_DN2769_c3_g1~~TRINITY_DN2769_c3_g1_i1.p1  ORF type:complete len:916 (-),score=249.49 TRINITY_DN2769_c3_g1_i1:162-2804(-)